AILRGDTEWDTGRPRLLPGADDAAGATPEPGAPGHSTQPAHAFPGGAAHAGSPKRRGPARARPPRPQPDRVEGRRTRGAAPGPDGAPATGATGGRPTPRAR